VHRILHQVGESGATFSGSKAQIGRREVIIIGHKCTPEGRLPSETSVIKILEWLTSDSEKYQRVPRTMWNS
jgi:hypothetical protein